MPNALCKSIFLLIFFIFSCSSDKKDPPPIASSQSSNQTWSSEVSNEQVNAYRTSEYFEIHNDAYDSIYLAQAYATLENNGKNIAGDDYIVGVIDSGANLDHNEFQGKIEKFGHSDDEVDDVSGYGAGHGSHVSGIIAAKKDGNEMHGVAYNAKVAPYKIFGDNQKYFSVSAAVNQARADGVKIINMSLSSTEDASAALINAKNSDILSIISTGNDAADNPAYPAYYAIHDDIKGSIIAVGNYQNSIGAKRWTSNECGDAKQYCLFAPGSFMYSPIHGDADDYGYKTGTSMAAPVVSGAAAILRSAWPHLTNVQTSQILLSTATDIGDEGVDDVYGRGLLNMQAAVNSIGSDQVSSEESVSISGSGYSASQSDIFISRVFGDSFAQNVAPIVKKAVYFDDFGRDYRANLDQKIHSQNHYSILSGLMFNDHSAVTLPIQNKNNQIQLRLSQNNSENTVAQDHFIIDKESYYQNRDQNRRLSLSFSSNIDDKLSFGFVTNEYINQFDSQFTNNFSLIGGNLSYFNDLVITDPLSQGQVQQRAFFINQDISDNLSSSFSYRTSGQSDALSQGDIANKAFSSKLNYRINKTELSFDYMNMTEYQNRSLGSVSLGAFSSDDESSTNAITISSKSQIFNNIYAISSYIEGRTDISGNRHGIFRDFSTIKSSGYSFGIFQEDSLIGGNFAINYSQPLRVYDGSVDIDIPVSRDIQGNIQRLVANNVPLSPSGCQRNFEISYGFSRNLSNLQLNFLLIKEPGHISTNEDEYIYYLKYSSIF